jgi:hypothetical protein
MMHSISGQFKVCLGWIVPTILFTRGERFKPTEPRCWLWVQRGSVTGTKGVLLGQQGGWYPGRKGTIYTTEPGGIMEVAMLGFDLAWV